jgi:hypothetical protein
MPEAAPARMVWIAKAANRADNERAENTGKCGQIYDGPPLRAAALLPLADWHI